MQNVLIEKPYRFIPPFSQRWLQRVLLWGGIHHYEIRRTYGVTSHETRHRERLRASLDAGHSVLLLPNHPRTADPAALCYLARETPFDFYMMASWHLFHQNWFNTFIVRAMGAFSVYREGLDRKAVDYAIDTLEQGKRVLAIFAEGTTSRTNDRLLALMEGPALIARTAAKRRQKRDGGKVMIHPVAIKYFFDGNIETTANQVLTDIEHKLTWRSQSTMPLIDRLIKVGNAMLTLKEMEYGLEPTAELTLRERQTRLVNHLLDPIEREWLGKVDRRGVQIRIKNLRTRIFPEISENRVDARERERRWRQLEDTYLAQQVDCYPEQYVTEYPSVDRILETVEKFEEDLTDKARVHGQLKVVIDVGEPIEVPTVRERGVAEDPLMNQVRSRLDALLSGLKTESALYAGPEFGSGSPAES